MRAAEVVGNVVRNFREEVTGDRGGVCVFCSESPHDTLLEMLLLHSEKELKCFSVQELLDGILDLVKRKELLFDKATRTWQHRDLVSHDEPRARQSKGRGKRHRQNIARARRRLRTATSR